MFGSNNGSDSTTSSSSPPKDANSNSNSSSSAASGTSPPAPPAINTSPTTSPTTDKKRKSSKASQLIASAKNTLSSTINNSSNNDSFKVIYKDDQLPSPGAVSNAAGDSKPTSRNTFRVGVTEDKNKKCRRTMEDTHSFVYNFLQSSNASATNAGEEQPESDNGYFAIFDGHAGTYAADWCGRKLHVVLEETIKRHPNTPIPELLDMTFTNCDGQLEKLPVKNSGCTAVCAVLRWEDRRVLEAQAEGKNNVTTTTNNENSKPTTASSDVKTERQRVLYTANVGDARIVLCRNGKALRLSYDHKGSDESEGKRVANAGGLILNNRVNGVLAVTRALGDSYMKELVTGHPYTTETVLLPESDEFIILACDGLWDVCSDQEAVDLVRGVQDPQEASKMLVDYALNRFSSDNLSCMIVRMDTKGNFGQKASASEKESTGSDNVGESAEEDNKAPVEEQPKAETQAKDTETKEKTSEAPMSASAPS